MEIHKYDAAVMMMMMTLMMREMFWCR